MMDFPSSPSVGQTFNSGSGAIYVWDGVAWSIATSQTATALQNNLIVNSNMMISQENGATAVTAVGAYPVDQWIHQSSGLTGAAGQQLNQFNQYWVTQAYPTPKASLAAGDYGLITQLIEGYRIADLKWGTASAKQVVLRFEAYSDVPGSVVGVTLRNNAFDRVWTGSFTLTSTPTVYTFVIPGDTTGTWLTDTGIGIRLGFCPVTGTGNLSPGTGWQAGSGLSPVATNNAATTRTVLFSNIGLYADPNRTGLPPPFQAPEYATELVKCQRYFEFASGASIYGYQLAGAVIQSNYPFKVKKRVVPSMGALSWTSTNNGSGQTPALTTADGFVFQAAAAATGTMFFQGLSCNASARM
jgi:hypothetical protein